MDDETAVTEKYDNLSEKKESRKKRHKLLVTELFLDFSKNTTLHGLRYVTQIGLSTVEKIFWLLMFVISVVLCFLLILQVWFKWCDSPVIVTITERMIPVEEVPFPSVTICPQMKDKVSKYEYAKQYSKYNEHVYGYKGPLNDTVESELKMLDDAMLVCDSYSKYRHVLKNNVTNESTVHNIVKIAPRLEDATFPTVYWREEGYLNIEMFSTVLTSEGVCFTFNSVQQKDMFKNESIQNQYLYVKPPGLSKKYFFMYWAQENLTVYPRRGRDSINENISPNISIIKDTPDPEMIITNESRSSGQVETENGPTPDLVVMLKQNVSDNDGLCNNLYSGYKVYLHHPDDMPQSSLYYYPVLPGQVTSLALKFSAMSTSESLMKHTPELRQCYSSSDHELRYFKTYTSNNCKLECLSIYIYKRCRCIPFYMPHSNSSEICPAQKKECINRAQIKALKSKELKTSMGDVCNCLPSCNSVEYEADVFKTNFDWKKYKESMYNHSSDGYNYSRLEVYFKEPRFVSMRRSELFGLTDFLANCGGLLGLFLGFSFLSIIEVLYFCTLRLWYALRRDKGEKKKIDKVGTKGKNKNKGQKTY